MENKIKTTPINPILGGLSIAINMLFNLVGCIQIAGEGLQSGGSGTGTFGEAKLVFALLILIAGILSFINIKVKNKVMQIISSVLYFVSSIIPMLVLLIIDNKYISCLLRKGIDNCYSGVDNQEYVAGLIQVGVIFAIIGITMGILCLLPVIKKNRK